MLKFEWDINKANAHQKKQGVTFEEASTVLSDVFSITVTDPLHPENEERGVTIGQSDKHRTLSLATRVSCRKIKQLSVLG